jgi:hypothetical protein
LETEGKEKPQTPSATAVLYLDREAVPPWGYPGTRSIAGVEVNDDVDSSHKDLSGDQDDNCTGLAVG